MVSRKFLSKTYSRVWVGKCLSDTFPSKSCLNQGDALLPSLFNFDLQYTIRMVHANQESLKLNTDSNYHNTHDTGAAQQGWASSQDYPAVRNSWNSTGIYIAATLGSNIRSSHSLPTCINMI